MANASGDNMTSYLQFLPMDIQTCRHKQSHSMARYNFEA